MEKKDSFAFGFVPFKMSKRHKPFFNFEIDELFDLHGRAVAIANGSVFDLSGEPVRLPDLDIHEFNVGYLLHLDIRSFNRKSPYDIFKTLSREPMAIAITGLIENVGVFTDGEFLYGYYLDQPGGNDGSAPDHADASELMKEQLPHLEKCIKSYYDISFIKDKVGFGELALERSIRIFKKTSSEIGVKVL